MNRLTRLFVASGAGLALTLTASPALAAPPSDPHGNGAHIERNKYSDTSGSYDYRTVVYQRGDTSFINSRDQQSFELDSNQYSYDWKTHEAELGNVSKFSSHTTSTENGVTCRTNSLRIVTNDVTRRDTSDTCDLG